ncbi:MAG: BACON domain-containing protein [Tannerellaceae bacterium]
MNKLLSCVIFLFLMLYATACSTDNELPEVPTLQLSHSELSFDPSGGQKTIELQANGDWVASDLPDWIELDKKSGSASQVLTLTILANEKTKQREANVCFQQDQLSASIQVSQEAKEKEITWASLGFSFFEQADFTLADNQLSRQYQFATNELLITAGMKDKVFLGNLINRNLGVNSLLPCYDQYTFIPITVFPIGPVNVKDETFTPSLQAQQAYAAKVIDAKPNQQLSFKSDLKGIHFDSYRELRLIGEGNMGVKLDELISGKPYTEQEMVKNEGFIFSYDQTVFALTLDLQEKMVEEVLKVEDFPAQSLSYISMVSYGRVGLLIVETDNDLDDVKTIVRKKLQNSTDLFTEEETAILAEIEVSHAYLDQSQSFVAKRGKAEIITDYLTRLTDHTNEAYPYKITVSDYFSHANEACSFEYFLK